jgi:hypothetical protein
MIIIHSHTPAWWIGWWWYRVKHVLFEERFGFQVSNDFSLLDVLRVAIWGRP